jgi:UDP-N-acetylglucosamine--N-acetylmuramyl-(pentapeptide) pyrophosphoryl-undecaprenol N-acetylglucosamine transferase
VCSSDLNSQLARKASAVALTFEEARAQARSVTDAPLFLTGNPVRPQMTAISRDEARSALGLGADEVLVLVFGGSRGARALNEAFVSLAPELLASKKVHIVHATGQRDFESIRRRLDSSADTDRYDLVAYLDEMDRVMPAADLVISRAGSTSIAEIAALAIPSVLVPFPHATGDHQTKNARALVEAGAAVMIGDDRLGDAVFENTVRGLIEDHVRRRRMHEAARSLQADDALSSLARLVKEVASGSLPMKEPV